MNQKVRPFSGRCFGPARYKVNSRGASKTAALFLCLAVAYYILGIGSLEMEQLLAQQGAADQEALVREH